MQLHQTRICGRRLMCLLVILSAFIGICPGYAGNTAERAKAKLDKQVYKSFKDELKVQDEEEADHVLAYAIVKAKVNAVGQVPFCMFATSRCGLNPTCNHPKRMASTLTLTIGQTLFSTSDAALPKRFKDYPNFKNADLAPGDEVVLSLYVYKYQVTKDGNSHISKIIKVKPQG